MDLIHLAQDSNQWRAFVNIVMYIRPPLWSSGQSSWLQIRRPGFDSRHYQIFREKKKKKKENK
jgi:hypothetical protein